MRLSNGGTFRRALLSLGGAVSVALAAATAPCAAPSADTTRAWTSLFNGRDLSGWDTYLGPRYNPKAKKFDGPPVGLNHDPDGVFSVEAVDGAPAIHISGTVWGGLSTQREYQDYHLRLQFKWGDERYAPRESDRRDSGVLYHATGRHAAEWFFWMQSLEMQVEEGNCGDFWALGGTLVEARSRAGTTRDHRGRLEFVYAPQASLHTFQRDLPRGGHVKGAKGGESERPRGQWNTLELFTVGSTSVHVVNGAVKAVLRSTSRLVDGRIVPLQRGKLQLQSEGAEVYYRHIEIRQIKEIPERLLER